MWQRWELYYFVVWVFTHNSLIIFFLNVVGASVVYFTWVAWAIQAEVLAENVMVLILIFTEVMVKTVWMMYKKLT